MAHLVLLKHYGVKSNLKRTRKNEKFIGVKGRRFPKKTPQEDFSVRWSGELFAPKTGNYKFHLLSDDGARLAISNNITADNWKLGPRSFVFADIHMDTGWHPILIEYFQATGEKHFLLHWCPPGDHHESIPPKFLRPSKPLENWEPPRPFCFFEKNGSGLQSSQ